MIGNILPGGFRIEKPLGTGGMGAVYEATQLDLRRRVALKILHETDPRTLARFRQEALATARLRSRHVVEVYSFHEGPPAFLAMELVAGESLHRLLIREKRLPVARAVAIAAQMLAALDEAHRAGIIHRDIKPSNVMIGEGDHVKLVDFGIAKIVEDEPEFRTTTGTFLGTPAYAPPEQIAGPTKDPRSDLYSVAACLYEMCAGRRPFADKKGGELASAILKDMPPSLATVTPVPEELSRIVDRSLAKDLAARFPDACAMRDALLAVVAPPAAPAPAKSRAAVVVVALSALVVTIVGAAVMRVAFAKKTRDEPPPAPAPSEAPLPVVVDAEPEPSAAPSVSASAAPPARLQAVKEGVRGKYCRCSRLGSFGTTGHRYYATCTLAQKPPRCECKSNLRVLCQTRPDVTSGCPNGGYYTPEGSPKTGLRCGGYFTATADYESGDLQCDYCRHAYGEPAIPAEEGAPCFPIDPNTGEAMQKSNGYAYHCFQSSDSWY